MIASIATVFTALTASVSAGAIPKLQARGGGVPSSGSASMTPHAQFSSSIGVVGPKVDTNRVLYWPYSVSCDNICVKVSHGGRSLHLIHVDTSGGAHDMSYDAWNYLAFGKSATQDPQSGGGIDMEFETVDNSECKDILNDGKLPLIAANGLNYAVGCPTSSWAGKNYELLNLVDSQGNTGWDEKCTLDLSVSNQPKCAHPLVDSTHLSGLNVVNIEYPSGKKQAATIPPSAKP